MFVGDYIKSSIVDPIVACALANENLALISRPGWAKTRAGYYTAKAIAGADRTVLVNLNPSTPPSRVEGRLSTVALLNDREEFIVADTAFDPTACIVILDELFRANVAVDDLLLPLLEPHTDEMVRLHGHKTIIATSNWVGSNERLAALRDRFACIVHINAALPDIGGLVESAFTEGTVENFPFAVPTWDEIVKIRQLWPGPQAKSVITTYLQLLYEEAVAHNNQKENSKGGRVDESHFSPRRFIQWSNLLFRHAAWLTEQVNFAALPAETIALMEHAFPAVTDEESQAWKSICRNVGNQGEAAARAILGQALSYYQGLEGKFSSNQGRADGINLVTEASNRLAEFEEQLRAAVGESSTIYKNGYELLNELLSGCLNQKPLDAVAKKIRAL